MIVSIQGLGKRLGSFCLEDISMELPAGYIMGLIGQNGAGKTSLLCLLLGLYEPDAGSVRIDGMGYRDQERAIREQTGAVLLEDLFEEGLSLQENGKVFGQFFRNYRPEQFAGYLERFELDKRKRYRSLSRGERLKLQLAFALSHEAKLLVLDEPTGNFDRSFRREFFRVLKEFIADGTKGVILATHLTDDLDRVADYILYLESGRSVYAGDIETLRKQYRIAEGERNRIDALPKEHVICVKQGEYGARALVRGGRSLSDNVVRLRPPTLEELMYFMSKRNG